MTTAIGSRFTRHIILALAAAALALSLALAGAASSTEIGRASNIPRLVYGGSPAKALVAWGSRARVYLMAGATQHTNLLAYRTPKTLYVC
jgi:hypothetical protein